MYCTHQAHCSVKTQLQFLVTNLDVYNLLLMISTLHYYVRVLFFFFLPNVSIETSNLKLNIQRRNLHTADMTFRCDMHVSMRVTSNTFNNSIFLKTHPVYSQEGPAIPMSPAAIAAPLLFLHIAFSSSIAK